MGVQIRALLAWLAYATLAYTQFLRSPRDVRGRPGASRVTSFGHVQYSVDMGSNSPGAGLAVPEHWDVRRNSHSQNCGAKQGIETEDPCHVAHSKRVREADVEIPDALLQ